MDSIERMKQETEKMEEGPSSDSTATPLLRVTDDGEENTRPQVWGWLNRVLDMEETKHQILFSLPMILTNIFYYLITSVSVMLAGHLGELQLAGATLANSWFNVTGSAVMVIPLSLLKSLSCNIINNHFLTKLLFLTSLFMHLVRRIEESC